jgi:hypothetical protein
MLSALAWEDELGLSRIARTAVVQGLHMAMGGAYPDFRIGDVSGPSFDLLNCLV